jgi:hypothetical protein
LHPALKVVTEEIGCDSVEHIDGEWAESNRFLVVVVPEYQRKGNEFHFFYFLKIGFE